MNLLLSILKIVPVVLEVLKAVEQHAPVSGAGKDKLAFVQQVIAATYDVAGDLIKDLPGSKALEIVTRIVQAGVDLFNKVGVFKKAGA